MRYLLCILCCALACVDSSRGPGSEEAGSGGGSGQQGESSTGGDGTTEGGGGTTSGGCMVGDRFYEDGETGIPAADGCNTCICDKGELGCTLLQCATPNLECVVAIRLDTCCTSYEATSRAKVDADECLIALPIGAYDPVVDRNCKNRNPVDCSVVRCAAPAEPESRLATADGGGCRFTDECQADDDCVLARDVRPCCSCPQSMPRIMVQQNPCLIIPAARPAIPDSCVLCVQGPACGACAPTTDPVCLVGGGSRVCR